MGRNHWDVRPVHQIRPGSAPSEDSIALSRGLKDSVVALRHPQHVDLASGLAKTLMERQRLRIVGLQLRVHVARWHSKPNLSQWRKDHELSTKAIHWYPPNL